MDQSTDQPPPAAGTTVSRQPPEPLVGEDGAPLYDQDFFLALARCGKDIWNEWRTEHSTDDDIYITEDDNTYIKVTFKNVDFRNAPNSEIDFAGFNFGYLANLSGATFGDHANLSGATFGDQANLSGATFGDYAKLSGATFGEEANLSGATLGDYANLSAATFGYWADLSGATSGHRVNLSAATFGRDTKLNVWSSEQRAKFRIALAATLSHVWSEDRRTAFVQGKGTRAADSNRLSSIRFAGARFLGDVDFSGRRFGDIADFSMARFDEPPRFDSLVNINSYGAKIGFTSRVPGWTTRSVVATQLRHLRKLADDAKNHNLERDLYIEERRAERGIYLAGHMSDGRRSLRQRWRGITGFPSAAAFPLYMGRQVVSTATRLLIHLGWIAVMGVYWLLADYGRSFVRPLLAPALSIVLFHAAYLLALRPQGAADFRERAAAALRQAVARPQATIHRSSARPGRLRSPMPCRL